ncbi:MFS transporter [Lactiplantibacillus plantarum]|uniref:MFS transporter n=1 Tax=Lactiplantibacillus plantarum TaxID=1590 RepID=UPI002E798ED3|nr:MFS transporter [Lactiplantibacillus plantarum]WVI02476.1 MFS transporter [Lactiplantibacillus plantarum]
MQPRLTTTISILSLSTVTGITTVITGIIPQLKRTFPTVPTTLIEWLVTIANCSALITLLLNPRLTSRWGLRPIVISGLLISAIMGLIPAITTNFTVIMVSRLGLGLGVGLFSPHAISLLTHSFTGDLRARLLGYQTGLSALGNAILLGLAGLLISLSWHAVFWLYGLLVIVAGGVAWFVPEPTVPSTTTNHARTEKTQLPRHQLTLLGLTFITYLLIWGVQLKLPSYFSARHFGNAATINLTLGYAGAAISVLVLWLASNATVAIGAAVFFNFIYSYTGPYLVFTSNTGLDTIQVNVLSSYLTIATIISAFFAPLVWNSLGQLGPQTLTANVLIWIMLILGGLALITGSHHPRKEV